jgi:anti-sigma B factor antagonist
MTRPKHTAHLVLLSDRGDILVNFKIETENLETDVPVIELEGEVDVYTAPQLKQQMISMLESGTKQMVVDLTKVDYFDSTALGVLIGGLKRIRERDGNLSLICPNPRIRRVFEITGLDKIFDIYTSADEAKAGIRIAG